MERFGEDAQKAEEEKDKNHWALGKRKDNKRRADAILVRKKKQALGQNLYTEYLNITLSMSRVRNHW